MYAFVGNGYQAILKNQRQLEYAMALYPYPKFRKCRTEEEARAWLRRNQRGVKSRLLLNYGDTAISGYIAVSYLISAENGVSYELDTSQAGYVKIWPTEGILLDQRQESIHIVIPELKLNDRLIAHHTLAVYRCLRILGEYVDVCVSLPDISVYLALTKYTGKNYLIKTAQQEIAKRLAAVSFSIVER